MRFREHGILIVLLGLGVLLWVVAPRHDGGSAFLDRDNLMQVARACSFTGTAAVGATLVIVAGGIDLAAGSVLGLAVVVVALLASRGTGLAVACLGGLLAAAACGAASGLLIARAGLPPFIATLGMLSIARGAGYWLTGGQIVGGLPESFTAFGQGFLGGVVPWPVVIMLLAALAGSVLLTRTAFGRGLRAIGGNEEAARLSGLPVTGLKVAVYTLGAATAGLAGLLYAARFGYGSSTAGLGWELQIISAVVIGGTSLAGGDGSVIGSVLGAAVMGLITNGLTLLSVPEEYNQFVVGGIILVAVLADRFRSRRSTA